MTSTGNIAIIYFSRSAQAESKHKQWFDAGSDHRNMALATSLVAHGSHIVNKSGFPVFHYHEGNQIGLTFGERIANAFSEVFNKGYEAAIAVGNDSPELDGTNWQSISDQLRKGENVLGPSVNGGAYLVGLTAATYNSQKLQQLPWQTHRLFDALLHLSSSDNMRTHVLKKLQDVNSFSDVLVLIKSNALSKAFKTVLLNILDRFKTLLFCHTLFIENLFSDFSRPLRAPPVLAL
ncbi:DUF2064 domain-containing protein [Fulvivirga sp. M361]|uniref:DUF2064 domain-containing protein n=1 Tax=Fulvivirga sp. M361 TaxID=2594266 RepID=UPI00117AD3D4|nr:DUF2064 domain-containing protein [Fulvivirga sp. M361]TRX52202.1 DUF2064 domain-containing protein [Fulvivirga sp. M361]